MCSARKEAEAAVIVVAVVANKTMIEAAIPSRHPVRLLTQHPQLHQAKTPMPNVSVLHTITDFLN